MSTNNLLLSLLPNCSNNFRSSSLTPKNHVSPFFSFYPRSSSTDYTHTVKQKPTVPPNDKKWTPLLRMAHLLNVKIKKAYYFVFCKLQQSTKNNQTKVTLITQEDSKLEVASHQPINHKHSPNSMNTLNQKIIKGIAILDQTCSTLKTKINIRLQKEVYSSFFRKLKRNHSQKLAIQMINKSLAGLQKQIYLQFIHSVEKQQNQNMRNQILMMTLDRLYKNQLTKAIKIVKQWREIRVKLIMEKCFVSTVNHEVAKTPRSYYNNKSVNFAQKNKPEIVKTVQIDMNQTNLVSARTNRGKKIVLREKKLSTAEPISFAHSEFTKAYKVRVNEDPRLGLDKNCASFQNGNELMSRLKNVKQQIFVNFIPDLVDNCNIFSELPFTSQFCKYQSEVKYDNCFTEIKHSFQLQTQEDCLTDRQKQRQKTTYRQSKQSKQTPAYSKHISPGHTIGRKMRGYVQQNDENSPLVKIDRILSKIEQIKTTSNNESNERPKKMVNVNIPRNIYETARKRQTKNTIDTVRTPLKENNIFKENNTCEVDRFRSSVERRGTERLLTEKCKENSGQKCSNFQLHSANKNKSAMIGKTKNERQQYCTARKMKMEIENLISRRNKELSRNQSQLK